mgnify:CR=1 FL=1
MLNWRIVSWSLGLTLAFSLVLCVIWGLATPDAVHMHHFLELVLPAFRWLTWWGFLLGLVEMARYGVAQGARVETFFGLAGLGDLVHVRAQPAERRPCDRQPAAAGLRLGG